MANVNLNQGSQITGCQDLNDLKASDYFKRGPN